MKSVKKILCVLLTLTIVASCVAIGSMQSSAVTDARKSILRNSRIDDFQDVGRIEQTVKHYFRNGFTRTSV